ncbi:hypothetical protein EDD25_1177 [Cryobacterium psychrophilum]|nr:hypothetical protein EDD25_1177 [Cryobacterium psychrophilum]
MWGGRELAPDLIRSASTFSPGNLVNENIAGYDLVALTVENGATK